MTKPTNWNTYPLSELVDVLDSQRIPINSSERSKRIGPVPYYGATGIVGTIDKAIFNEDLLILGEDGVQFFDQNKPKAYKITGPAWVNNHAHVLRPKKEKVLLNFLLHYLNHFNYVGYANGTTRLKLTQGAMNRIPIILPPIEEQSKIVEVLEAHLSRLDAAAFEIERNRKLSQKLLYSSTRKIVESVEHNYLPLGEVLEKIEAGKSFTCINRPSSPNEWGVIKVSAMTWGEFLPHENKTAPANYIPPPNHIVHKGDILFSRANAEKYVGASVLVKTEPIKLLLSDKSLRLVPKKSFMNEWLIAVLQSPNVQEQFSRSATGTKDSMRNISQSNILKVEVPVPIDSKGQTKVIELMNQLTTHIASHHKAVEESAKLTRNLRNSILRSVLTEKINEEKKNV